MELTTQEEWMEALRWQVAIGADEAIGDKPTLARWKTPVQNSIEPIIKKSMPVFSKPSARVTQVYKAPAPPMPLSNYKVAADSIPSLEAELKAFDGCPLK